MIKVAWSLYKVWPGQSLSLEPKQQRQFVTKWINVVFVHSAAHKKIIWFPLETYYLLSSQSFFFFFFLILHMPHSLALQLQYTLPHHDLWPMLPVWKADTWVTQIRWCTYCNQQSSMNKWDWPKCIWTSHLHPSSFSCLPGAHQWGLGLTKQCNLMEISPKLLAISSHHWGCHSHLASVKPSTLYSAIYRPQLSLVNTLTLEHQEDIHPSIY